MIDSPLIAGAARMAIEAIGRTYELSYGPPGNEEVHYVNGIFQKTKAVDERMEDNGPKRSGYQRFMLKTDPESPDQPAVGDRFDALDEQWQITTKPARKGLFLVWPCMKIS